MSDVQPLHVVRKGDVLTDRSRITTDWTCPRRRYWQYEFQGRGIVPNGLSLELFMGTVLHDGLARVAEVYRDIGAVGPDVTDLISVTAADSLREALLANAATADDDTRMFADEQAALVEGLLRGFVGHVWPRLTAAYPTVVQVEQEMVYRVSDRVVLMSRPDLVLADGEASWYIEYKSTSSKRREWMDSWATAVQLHSTVRAIEATTGTAPAGVIIQGLYKGFSSYDRQNSPFCYAYVKDAIPPFTKEQVAYEYRAGLRRQPTWTRPGGVAAWVAGMPEVMLAEQFPQTPPILVKDDLVDAFFRQVAAREEEIAGAAAVINACGESPDGVSAETGLRNDEKADDYLNLYFPQRFDQCRPAWGRGCPYVRLCHGRVDDPLTEGFSWREAHHQPEIDRHLETPHGLRGE